MSRRQGTELPYTEWVQLPGNLGKSTHDYNTEINAAQQAAAKPNAELGNKT